MKIKQIHFCFLQAFYFGTRAIVMAVTANDPDQTPKVREERRAVSFRYLEHLDVLINNFEVEP